MNLHVVVELATEFHGFSVIYSCILPISPKGFAKYYHYYHSNCSVNNSKHLRWKFVYLRLEYVYEKLNGYRLKDDYWKHIFPILNCNFV